MNKLVLRFDEGWIRQRARGQEGTGHKEVCESIGKTSKNY